MTNRTPISLPTLPQGLKRAGLGLIVAILGIALSVRESPATTDQVSEWDALYQQVVEAHQAGQYAKAHSLAEQDLALAKSAFGARDRRTLTSIGNVAMTLDDEGQYPQAEAMYRETLRQSREAFGDRDLYTLYGMSNLAAVLAEEGRYGEAETLDRQALQLDREVLGSGHIVTLTSMNNLALALQSEGRLGDADAMYRETVQREREVLGPRDRFTVESMSNLATVWQGQGRYSETEELDRKVLELRREVLGPRHPDTLTSMSNLAHVLDLEGRFGEGEPLLRDVLQVRGEDLGLLHPDTLTGEYDLAWLLALQGRYDQAEELYRQALQHLRNALGPRHIATLLSMNGLGLVLLDEGRNREADVLFREALHIGSDVLGPGHPTTLMIQLDMVGNLAAQGRVDQAASLQRQMEPQVLAWLGVELYSTEAATARRQLVASQSIYQDFALSLAMLPGASTSAGELAALAVLRFKSLAAEEESYLRHLVRLNPDPRIRTIATEIAQLHQQLAKLFLSDPSGQQVKDLTSQLDDKELELGRVSRDYASYLQVKNVSLKSLKATLPANGALLELRAYQPVDFKRGQLGGWRWAGVLIPAEGDIEVHDLGASGDTATQVQAILAKNASAEAATAALSDQLLTPFAPRIAKLRGLYVALDGVLALLPFGLLHDATGHRLMDSLDLRTVQTGRDLLRPPPEHAAKGLVAVGGIDFGAIEPQPETAEGQTPVAEVQPAAVDPAATVSMDEAPLSHTRAASANTFRSGFASLASSKLEVEAIGSQYRIWRRDEPVSIVEGDKPTKEWLMALSPPRVLHLATHGFYREPKEPADQPMLLAGVALAGANQSLKRQDASGILYALEAEDLNLEGTELVVLSACDTALGQIDYGEGVSGLVRALRTAGARNVLVTLRPVDDQGAERFVERFYYYWFKQEHSDPAAALRDAQREAASKGEPTWTSFVLIGK